MEVLRRVPSLTCRPVITNLYLRWSSSGDFPKQNPKVAGPKVYTRTGDGGTSAVFTGERRQKDDLVFEALGATDELTSCIGLAKEYALDSKHEYHEQLKRIQCILQDISTAIATPKSTARESHLKRSYFSDRHTKDLEEWIDEYVAKLPPLENFILPGGGKASATLHMARSICRRAERCVVPLVRAGETGKSAQIYLNRLADYLFTVSRYAAKLDSRTEVIYIRPSAPAESKQQVDKDFKEAAKTASDVKPSKETSEASS